MIKKYFAEFIGTFALSFVVISAVGYTQALPMAVPLIAGLTLMLFVYSIGPISGCHINPAVTLAQLSVKKISLKEAIGYIVAQLLGAFVAMLTAKGFAVLGPNIDVVFNIKIFFAEMLGALFFNFGIASVVYGKVKEHLSGVVVGGSLLLGILFASLTGAAGILNPAVAIALNAVNIVYLLAPIIGAICGFQLYRVIAGEK